MALETRVSYNSESSEFVSAQPIIYELLSRIANSIEENRVRATGRSLVRSDETIGLDRGTKTRASEGHFPLRPDSHQARPDVERC